jgi:cytidylate kinase
MIIAIDGPAASGKGTIAKQVAAVYGLHHLDTGLIYRAVAKAVLDSGHSPDDVARATEVAIRLDPTKFEDKALKAQVITEAASVVAAIPQVRQALMNYQREFATKPPGAVLDGRDIGTVIAPGADVKLFVVASPEVRAARRTLELKARGESADEQEVLADLLRRDERDSRRTAAPLKPAPDAHLLDTTHLGIDAAFRAAVEIIEAVRMGRKRG